MSVSKKNTAVPPSLRGSRDRTAAAAAAAAKKRFTVAAQQLRFRRLRKKIQLSAKKKFRGITKKNLEKKFFERHLLSCCEIFAGIIFLAKLRMNQLMGDLSRKFFTVQFCSLGPVT